MTLEWRGEEIKRRMVRAEVKATDETMAEAVADAQSNHGAGAHSRQRFVSRSGRLVGSIRIMRRAKQRGSQVVGEWAAVGVPYAHRIELGFQGRDSRGRVISQRPLPFLRPAADKANPKLAGRIRKHFRRGR